VAVLVARLLAKGSFSGSKPEIYQKAINESHCEGLANAIWPAKIISNKRCSVSALTNLYLLDPDSDPVSEQEFGSGPAATKITNNNFKKTLPKFKHAIVPTK
jgi:hypothetical protein